MKSKVFAKVLCVVLCMAIIGSVLLIAVPMITGSAVSYTPTVGSYGTINDDGVNMRSGPGMSNTIVTTMKQNTKVIFQDSTSYSDGWYKVKELTTNKTGYVYGGFIDNEAPVHVSSIKLCAKTAFTYVGCQYAFWQTGAQHPAWTSSNTAIATIDSNGVLTAKAAGTVTITAAEGGEFASCTFTVKNGSPTGISAPNITLPQGKSSTLTARMNDVKWYSSNINVADVKNGVVTALSPGYATISAYNSSGASTCLVKVTDPPQSSVLRLSSTKASTYVGCQYAFGVTGATTPIWTSSNTAVATIDDNGVLTAKSAGETTIYVMQGTETSYCKFTVMNGNSTGISQNNMTLINGTTAKLTASTSGVKWYSSRSNIVSVSGGVLTAKGEGYVTISAYTSSGASTCLVRVISGPQSSGIKPCALNASTYVGCKYAFWQTGASDPAWTVSDPDVASIDDNGILTANSAGAVTLTISEGSNNTYCRVTIKEGTPTGIYPTMLTLQKGKTGELSATFTDVKWFSSNTPVASVSNGVVTAKSVGYATISAYNANGASTCLVRVVDADQGSPVTAAMGFINEEYVNLRTGPGLNYDVVTSMSANTSFSFMSDTLYNDGWYHILLADGTEGYVYSSFVTKIEPPKITLNAVNATTYVGCQYALTQTGAEYPTWSSSNTSVATVDQNGVVTAKSAGTATIYTSENGGVASCKFTVKNGTTTNIAPASLTLAAGKTAILTAKAGVNWFSSNKAIATVSGGTVTAKSAGYVTISAYNSSGASTCLIKVTEGAGTIKLHTTSATTYVGCQYAISMTGSNTASWTSSNTVVATVNSNGVVTAKSPGTTTIKASNTVSTATCTITVKSGYATGISSSGMTIASGKSVLLYSDTSYANWFSSNTSIATVSNGIVNTKGTGYVTISAYTSSGASTCLLNVTAPDNIRFVYASPNSAPKNSTVTFKAITDKTRTAVRFVVTNGSTSYTVNATSKVTDGNTYIWSGSQKLGSSGVWKVKAYSKTASTDYATTADNGEGEVFVTNSTDTTTPVLGERRASDEIIDMIAYFEGFLTTLTADYITSDPTIGYGKVVLKNEQFYNNLTKNEAYAYLCQTVNYGPYTTVTNDFLTSNNVMFNQCHFDALVCFGYNVGAHAITNDSVLKNLILDSFSGGGNINAGAPGFVNTSGVNLRSGAGTSYSILTSMSQNTSFTFVDGKLYNTYWYKIKLTNGTTGYIHKDYASSSAGGVRNLNNINKSAFMTRILQYHHAAGSCYIGLLRRRVDEVEIFFYGDYGRDGAENKYNIYFRCSSNSSFGIG